MFVYMYIINCMRSTFALISKMFLLLFINYNFTHEEKKMKIDTSNRANISKLYKKNLMVML